MSLVRSIFPQNIERYSPSEGSASMVFNTQRFSGGISGNTESIAFPGERWNMNYSFDSPGGVLRREMQSWALSMRGHQHRFYSHDWSYEGPSGVTSSFNVLSPNGTRELFEDVSSWTLTDAATQSGTLSKNGGYWLNLTRIESSGSSIGMQRNLSANAQANRPYFWRLESRQETFTAGNPLITFSSVANANDYVGAFLNLVENGVSMGSFVTTTSTLWARLFGSKYPEESVLFANMQISRCALTQTGSQTGDIIQVYGLEPDEAQSLRAGDYVEFTNTSSKMSSLHTLISDADTSRSTSGSARLYLSNPVRFSPASGSPVVLFRPSVVMTMQEASFGWGYNNLDRSIFSISAEESLYGR